jgi:hypothetical protein
VRSKTRKRMQHDDRELSRIALELLTYPGKYRPPDTALPLAARVSQAMESGSALSDHFSALAHLEPRCIDEVEGVKRKRRRIEREQGPDAFRSAMNKPLERLARDKVTWRVRLQIIAAQLELMSAWAATGATPFPVRCVGDEYSAPLDFATLHRIVGKRYDIDKNPQRWADNNLRLIVHLELVSPETGRETIRVNIRMLREAFPLLTDADRSELLNPTRLKNAKPRGAATRASATRTNRS